MFMVHVFRHSVPFLLATWVAGCSFVDETAAVRQENPTTRLARVLDEVKRNGNAEEQGLPSKVRANIATNQRTREPASDVSAETWNPDEGLPFVLSELALEGIPAPPGESATPLPPDELAHRIRTEEGFKRLRGEEVFEMTVGWPK